MKVNACAVFVLIAIAVCLDCVSADEEGSGPATVTNTCNQAVPEEIETKLHDCVVEEGLKVVDNETLHANSSEDYRLAVQKLCDNLPNMMQCLAGVVAASEGCLEGVEKTRLLLNVTFIETTMEVTCRDGGVNAASLEEEQHKAVYIHGTSDIFSKCKLKAMAKNVLTHEPNQDPNHVMKREYHVLRDARECLELLRGQGQDDFVEAGVAHWSNVLDRMKCVDIQTGTQILCKTIIEQ